MTEHIISFKIIEGGPETLITLPSHIISYKDLERIASEIQVALQQAEYKGERKALAFIMGEGTVPPVGIVKQSELSDEPPGVAGGGG